MAAGTELGRSIPGEPMTKDQIRKLIRAMQARSLGRQTRSRWPTSEVGTPGDPEPSCRIPGDSEPSGGTLVERPGRRTEVWKRVALLPYPRVLGPLLRSVHRPGRSLRRSWTSGGRHLRHPSMPGRLDHFNHRYRARGGCADGSGHGRAESRCSSSNRCGST